MPQEINSYRRREVEKFTEGKTQRYDEKGARKSPSPEPTTGVEKRSVEAYKSNSAVDHLNKFLVKTRKEKSANRR